MNLVHRSCAILALAVVSGGPSRVTAQETSTSTDALVLRAQEQFKAGNYAAALGLYRTVFERSKTRMNAARVSTAAAYAVPLPDALDDFGIWLAQTRSDATRIGDNDVSWAKIDETLKALKEAARRQQARIKTLEQDKIEIITKVETFESLLKKKDAILMGKDTLLQGKDAQLREKDLQLRERDVQLREKDLRADEH